MRAGIVQHRSSDSHDLDPFYDHVLAGLEETLELLVNFYWQNKPRSAEAAALGLRKVA